METLEIITEIQAMDSHSLLQLNNFYCDLTNNPDGIIYRADEFNDILQGYTPEQIANLIHFGSWSPRHEYFIFDGYGNLEGFYSLDADNLPDSLERIAEFIEENPDEFSDLF